MKIELKKELLTAIAIPVIAGGLVGILTANSMQDFEALMKPPLSPPGWLFPVVWTILYILMGIASYLVWRDGNGEQKKQALTLYGLQLIVNLLWPIAFFVLEWYLFAFAWLVLLWVLIYKTIRAFREINVNAAYLMLPYLLWVTFAAYLNLSIWWLNR